MDIQKLITTFVEDLRQTFGSNQFFKNIIKNHKINLEVTKILLTFVKDLRVTPPYQYLSYKV